MEKRSIGILGGMGPLATADLFRKITCLTKADCDNDHIRVYIDSNARIPDRTSAILAGGTDPVPEMTSALRHLEDCGADCIIMPCNTAHYFLPQLQAKTEIPFLSMLSATAKTCAAKFPGKTAAVLGTKGTLATGLYDRALETESVRCMTGLLPDELSEELSPFISGELLTTEEKRLLKAADRLSALIKCTEEQRSGNHEFDAALAQQKAALQAMHCPEADWFIEYCLPCYTQNLDELTRQQ